MPALKIWDGSAWIEVKGDKGDKGDPGTPGSPGTAATVSVGTVTTGAAGSTASVTEGGTAQARVLNFTIPKGDKGDTGNTGAPGTNATITSATASGLAAGATPTVTLGGTASARTFAFGIPQGAKGDKGDPGNTGATGPSPFHRGTTAPADPVAKPIWFDTST